MRKMLIASALLGWTVASTPGALAGDVHSPAAKREVFAGKCNPTNIGYRTSTDKFETESGDYQLVLGTNVDFKLAKRGCVTVTFTAESNPGLGNQTQIKASLDDGSNDAVISGIFFDENRDSFEVRGFNFIFQDVSTGRHNMKIFVRKSGPADSGPIAVWYRSTIAEFE